MTMVISSAFPSAILATLPAWDLEVSLTPPGQGPIWRSIASDVRTVSGFSVSRGRSDELQATNPGRFSCVLANLDRDYDPDHASSPFAGHIKPMRRIRLLARWASVTYVVFDGYVDQWQQEYPSLGMDVVASISATDGFKPLNRARINSSSYTDSVLPDMPNVYYKFNDSGAPTVVEDSGYLNHDGAYSGTPTFTDGLVVQEVGPALSLPASSPGLPVGVHTVDMSSRDWACEFWIETTQAEGSASSPAIAWWRNNDNAAAIVMGTATLGTVGHLRYATAAHAGTPTVYETTAALNDGAAHHVVLRDAAGTVQWVIDGATDSGTTAASIGFQFTSSTLDNGEVLIGDGQTNLRFDSNTTSDFVGTIDEFALYDPVLTAVRAQAHYTAGTTPFAGDASGARVDRILDAIGWPDVLRDLDTGTAILQAADAFEGEYALDLLRTLDMTERGQMYMGLDGDLSSDHVFKFVWRGRDALTTASRSTVSQATFSDTPGTSGDLLLETGFTLLLETGDALLLEGTGVTYAYAGIETDPSGETFLFNVIEVARRTGQTIVLKDAASIEEYGIRALPLTGLEFSTDAQALTLATAELAKYKDPRTRITTLIFKPQGDTSLWPVVLGAEIGNLYTADITPNNVGSAITRDVILVGKDLTVQNAEAVCVFRLAEVEAA